MEERRSELLGSEEIEHYREKGFLLPGKVLGDGTVEKLRGRLADLAGAPAPDGVFALDLMKTNEATKGLTFTHLAFLWREVPEFREVAFSPYLAQMAAQLLGTDHVVLFGDSAFVKPPQIGGLLHWHQDAMAWPLDKPGGVTCWIALDKSTPENGSMVFAEGSHLRGERLPVDATTGETRYSGYARYVADDQASRKGPDLSASGLRPLTSPKEEGFREVSTSYRPGDCSFHDSLVWHSSGVNTTNNFRRAYAIRYVDGHRLWVGEKKALYFFKDEESGAEMGAPIGGPNFPTVWPPAVTE
jgi:phytanoyl-CoA hydroxylase